MKALGKVVFVPSSPVHAAWCFLGRSFEDWSSVRGDPLPPSSILRPVSTGLLRSVSGKPIETDYVEAIRRLVNQP